MKKILSMIVIVSLFSLLMACSNHNSAANNSETPAGTERTELVLATDGGSPALSSIINRFNKNSESYEIKVVNYNSSERNVSHLKTEIIAGRAPDIYALSQDWFADVTIPLYEDLLPYLDADPIYSRETLVPSLFDAITHDGSLHYLPYDFFINTFTARESIVGVRSGITMEEADKFAKAMGSDVSVFPTWMSRETLLSYVVNFSIARFIDPAAGKCNFLDPEFIELLEQCRAHPYAPPEDSSHSELHSKNLLSNSVLQTFDAFIGLHNAYDTDYSFVGFPTRNRDGSTFQASLRLSISAQSQHKKAAWELVRTLMSEENQKNVEFFPSVQAEFNARVETVLEGDPNKTQVKLEQFEIDRFNSLINSITMVSNGTNTKLYLFIAEEAAAFFAGDKTAEEAAVLIQSRASLYVAE